tara:strand:+ start:1625 stop:2770 length:1146 start_codon:yes stop_codon:yes gene_type:complete
MQKKYQEDYLKVYASKASYSRGRIYKEKESLIRTPFQRDRDRIIHSSSFRRLKHKTQVFVNTDGDHYRTRLTHSMEVSQISRTLAKYLGLNEDLCETISLAHDMGHTPFGHAGEKILNECMKNFGGFNHNIQTLRIVSIIENKYYKFNGLNLTIETLDGLIKHNGPIKDFSVYDEIIKKSIFKNKIYFKQYPSLEAQISSISDDIAYNNHDLEDGLRAKLFDMNALKSVSFISKIMKKHLKNKKNFRREVIVNQIIRETINCMVLDVISNTKKNLKMINPKSIKDIYKQDHFIVDFSTSMKKNLSEIKEFLKINMYNNKKVVHNNNKGKKVINSLFINLLKNHKKYIGKNLFKNEPKERIIADYIAGMSDRFAINLYSNIK